MPVDEEAGEPQDADNEATPLLKAAPEDGAKEGAAAFNFQTKVLMYISVVSLLLLVIGLCLGRYAEGWDLVTTFYVLVQTGTTIGFGDVKLKTTVMRCYCCFLVLYALLTATYIASIKLYRQMEMSQMAFLHNRLEESLVDEETEDALQKAKAQAAAADPYVKLIVSTVPALGYILFGTIFFAVAEPCTCSYGTARVAGCSMESYATCVQTGGYVKTWGDAFYMCIITLTTVGFGDYSPRSRLGRCVGVLWMSFGVISVLNWIKGVSAFCIELQNRQGEDDDSELTEVKRAFKIIDVTGDGVLSQAEYVSYVLVKEGLVSEVDLRMIEGRFQKLDHRGKGEVSFEDLLESSRKETMQRQVSQSNHGRNLMRKGTDYLTG